MKKGFTLLEVLLAVTLLAFVGVAITEGLNQMASFSVAARKESMARNVLQNEYALLRSAMLTPMDETSEPDDDGVVVRRVVELQVFRNEENDEVLDIYKVTITATWEFRGESHSMNYETLVFQP